MAGSDAGSMASTAAPSGGVVERSFALLQTVVADGGPIGVRELSRRTGLARSTVARLLVTLERLAMVERDDEGRAVPGTALATLAVDSAATPLLRDRLRPLLAELVETFGESAALSVDGGDVVRYVGGVLSPHRVQARDVAGDEREFHLVAPGLCLMAWWERERLDLYLATELSAPTEFTMIDPRALRQRLSEIRSTGWVWTEQELDLEVNGLAVAAMSAGEMVGAVSIYGPAHRLSLSLHPDLGPELLDLVTSRVATLGL